MTSRFYSENDTDRVLMTSRYQEMTDVGVDLIKAGAIKRRASSRNRFERLEFILVDDVGRCVWASHWDGGINLNGFVSRMWAEEQAAATSEDDIERARRLVG
jgi:hypothetical protein